MTDDLSRLKIQRDPTPQIGGVRKRRRALLIAAAALLAIGAAAAFWPRTISVHSTTVVTTYPSQQFVVLNATGYVVAQRKAAVSSKATGRLEWLGVVEGSRVRENEIIARLDNRDVAATRDSAVANVKVAQANLATAEAELHNANSEFDRALDLVSKGFVSKSFTDTAFARRQKAVAGVAGAQSALVAAEASQRGAAVNVEYTLIRAPFDGVILSKSANVGDIVTPFSSAVDSKGAVVTMADMATLEVEADVSESSLALVQPGQPCEIALDALPDVRFRAVVSRIVPTVDRAKATVMTKVKFVDTDARVLPEMSAKVSFLSQAVSKAQQQPIIAANPDALVQRDGKTVAYAIKDDQAHEVIVTPGVKIGDVVAVSGLQSGAKVVLKPGTKVKNGSAVSVAEK